MRKFVNKAVKIWLCAASGSYGSVPRSIKDPITTNKSNVTGFLNLITAAKNAKVEKFIYASSSSVYGDNLNLPKLKNKLEMHYLLMHLQNKLMKIMQNFFQIIWIKMCWT